ncbi:MAG: hypothetical protein Q4A25_00065 [Candidatus Saccharibacteria bacterium]|nr:hypothetical protein [Candidatus Saccharibacteria bacterium]
MITVKGMIETLNSSTKNGEFRVETVRPLIVAIKKVYKDTSDSDDWMNLPVEDKDFERRLSEFERKSKKEFRNPRTGVIYKARARRALKMYKDCSDVQVHKKRVFNRRQDVFESVVDSYRRVLLTRLRTSLIDPKMNAGVEFFPFPVSNDSVGAIVVPSNITKENLRAGIKFLETYLEILEAKERRKDAVRDKTK